MFSIFLIQTRFFCTRKASNIKMPFKSPDADVTVFQFPKSMLIPSTSAFCLKLETFLRMANITYKNERTFSGSSKGKLPYITHKGKQVEDSNFIIKYINKELEIDLDANLSPAEKAVAHGFKRMCEENLYWVAVYQRWMVENGAFLKRMPMTGMRKKLLPVLLAVKVKPGLKSQLHGHGIGRHTKEEIYEIGENDIKALSDYLGDKPYLMGNEVSEVDATVFGNIAQWVYALPDAPLKKYVMESTKNLVEYCERIKEKYWPDWQECLLQHPDANKPQDQAKPAEPAAGDAEAKPEEPAVNGEQEKQAEGAEEQNAAGDVPAEQTNGEAEPSQETDAKPEPEQVEQAETKADEQTAAS
uniref:Transmembrane protein 87A-like n=1 Tax=Phallusia mammillata TaxID=59560 RepID=A0A6F9DVQ5_9ASCI|nr:transmembrane protein 87A-like [Phallusia mammillata]